MDSFDFETVYKTMIFLEWKWGYPGKLPTIEDIKKEAERLLEEAVNSYKKKCEICRMATGGFEVLIAWDIIELKFYIKSWQANFF